MRRRAVKSLGLFLLFLNRGGRFTAAPQIMPMLISKMLSQLASYPKVLGPNDLRLETRPATQKISRLSTLRVYTTNRPRLTPQALDATRLLSVAMIDHQAYIHYSCGEEGTEVTFSSELHRQS